MRLQATYAPAFARDIKRLRKRKVDIGRLEEVVELILANTPESLETLRTRHRMHDLAGSWRGSSECHVCNAGDWLLIWTTDESVAYFQRTGTHDELFRVH